MLNWEWFTDIPTCHLFIYLLLRVQFSEKSFRGIKVSAGELTSSLEIMSKESGLTVQQVRTSLKKLEKTGEITRTSTNRFTQIKVVKWGDYQDWLACDNTQVNKQLTNKQQTNNKQITTIKESNKEIKKERNKYIYAPSYESSSAIIQLPTNQTNDFYYIHSEDLEKYKGFYPALDIEQELRNMSAWLDANPKNRKTHNGMPRFINNWLSNSQNKARTYDKPKEKKGLDFFYE